MIKYIAFGTSVLLMLGGCAGQEQPAPIVVVPPKPVIQTVEKPKVVVTHAPLKKGEVPPLPEREKDIDLDSAVDGALNG